MSRYSKEPSFIRSATVDLLIRTGGEHRISNFFWQSAYAELVFSDVLWPDFGGESLDACLSDYAGRERRFGKTSEQVAVVLKARADPDRVGDASIALSILFVVPEDAFAMCVGLIVLVGAWEWIRLSGFGGQLLTGALLGRFQLYFDWLLRIARRSIYRCFGCTCLV